ncbi:MAG: hypothetical protein U9R34_06260 [Nanoarchaeota archaeon]|nr:hypothetical protein [Nanoarchaeota archaeon]
MTKRFNFKNKQFWQGVYDDLLNELRELDRNGLICKVCVREDQIKAYLYEQFKNGENRRKIQRSFTIHVNE